MAHHLDRLRAFLVPRDSRAPSSLHLTRLDLQVRFVASIVALGGMAYLVWGWGSLEYVRHFLLAWVAYVAACLGIAFVYWRRPQPLSGHYLFFLFDIVCITAVLVLLGQLLSVMIVVYTLVIMLAAVVNGRRSGVVVTIATVVCWGTAVALTYTGVLAAKPALPTFTFTTGWEYPAFFLWGVAILAGALYAAVVYADLARRNLADVERRYSESLQKKVEERTRDLQLANKQLRNVQTRLMEAERLAAAGELAGGVAHAINNPLAALIGTGMNCIEASTDPPTHVERMVRIARRIAAVVDGLLQLSRRGTLHPAYIDPEEVLDELETEIADRCKSLEIKIRRDPGMKGARLYADPVLLQTAMQSIADNAVEAMPDGGELGLETRLIDGTDGVEFRIWDTGLGIPPDNANRVLEAFFTTKSRGTGLGLSIAHGIVRGHEGTLRISRRDGGGTCVSVIMPCRALRNEADSPANPTAAPKQTHRTAHRTGMSTESHSTTEAAADDDQPR